MMKRLNIVGLALALSMLPAVGAAQGAVNGVVRNKTTGEPVKGVAITLMRVDRSMDLLGETFSDQDGRFQFDRDLVGASGQRAMGMLRAEYQGVNYSKPLPPMLPLEDVEIEVFEVLEEAIAPTGRVIVLEPGSAEMVVNESYLFENNSTPPASYRDPERGTLRFHLPPEAKGIVQVEASGPARMPLPSTADPSDEENIYQVDFPIKPGENRISLTYLVPRPAEGATFVVRTQYSELQTRVAAPQSITISGEGLTPLGAEPSTQAHIYELPRTAEVALSITGEGSLRRAGSAATTSGGEEGAGGGTNQIRIAPAPVARELPWILGVAGAVLAIGFFNLYGARRREGESAASKAPRSA